MSRDIALQREWDSNPRGSRPRLALDLKSGDRLVVVTDGSSSGTPERATSTSSPPWLRRPRFIPATWCTSSRRQCSRPREPSSATMPRSCASTGAGAPARARFRTAHPRGVLLGALPGAPARGEVGALVAATTRRSQPQTDDRYLRHRDEGLKTTWLFCFARYNAARLAEQCAVHAACLVATPILGRDDRRARRPRPAAGRQLVP